MFEGTFEDDIKIGKRIFDSQIKRGIIKKGEKEGEWIGKKSNGKELKMQFNGDEDKLYDFIYSHRHPDLW